MATDAAREAKLGALLSSLNVGKNGRITLRAFARMTGFSRSKVDRFFEPIGRGEVRHYSNDTARIIANVLPVDVETVGRAIESDSRYVAEDDSEALATVLSLLPNMDASDLAKVMAAAGTWFTGVRDTGGNADRIEGASG